MTKTAVTDVKIMKRHEMQKKKPKVMWEYGDPMKIVDISFTWGRSSRLKEGAWTTYTVV